MKFIKKRVNLKTYDVKTWLTNDSNTLIGQYSKMLKGNIQRQSGSEIWSVNRI